MSERITDIRNVGQRRDPLDTGGGQYLITTREEGPLSWLKRLFGYAPEVMIRKYVSDGIFTWLEVYHTGDVRACGMDESLWLRREVQKWIAEREKMRHGGDLSRHWQGPKIGGSVPRVKED